MRKSKQFLFYCYSRKECNLKSTLGFKVFIAFEKYVIFRDLHASKQTSNKILTTNFFGTSNVI